MTAADRPGTPADRPGTPADWEARLRGLSRALAEFAGPARRVGVEEHAAAQRSRDRTVERARDAAAVQRADVARALHAALASAHATAGRRLAELATGPACAPLDGPGWESAGVAVPLSVRVGTVVASGLDPALPEVPVVVPLLGTAGWVVEGEPDGLVLGTVLRVIAAAPPLRVRVDSYDPGLTGALGGFGALGAHDIVAGSMTGEAALADHVAELTEAASRRGALLREGAVFEELTGPLVEPYRMLVLLDYPSGVDGEVHRQLVRVAASAAGRGLCLLVHHNPDRPPAHGVEPGELLSRLRRFRARNDRWEIEGLPAVACRRDPVPPPDLVTAVSGVVAAAAARVELPTVDLADLLPERATWWGRVPAGAGAELRVDVGTDGRAPVSLRLRSANPPLPNLLVGGAVGQGKSNLLHVLVHGLAVRYPPADLQMFLLDFKQGLEFSVLGPGPRRPHWLPHIRVLGVYADREFGLAVLRHVERELDRRSELFKSLGGITDIGTIGPHVERRPPRVLLVLDEFQVMLAADDDIAEEAAALLEKLVRLGRAYGLHVVLATQTLEGIPRLALKRDAIFGQVPYRIVLKTTPSDSQAMLQLHNTAASGLRFRGQAVFNDNFGTLDANRHVLIARADQGELDRLRRELWQRGHDRPPRVFELDAAADLSLALARFGERLHLDAEAAPAWLGLPVGVEEDPVAFDVRPEPGAGLLLLGDDAATALGVLGAVAVTLAHAVRGRGDRFLLLDLLPDGPALAAGRDALVNTLGGAVELARAAEVPRRLYELRDAVRLRSGHEPPLHVFGLGLHRAVRLTTPAGGELDPPSDALREVAHQGAPVGVFLYGWWNRLKACRDHLGFDPPIGAYLFLRHPLDGVKEVCGPFVRWSSRPSRGLLHDGLTGEPRPVVTFASLVDGPS